MCCSSAKSDYEGKSKLLGRKAVTFVLFTLTGGVGLSALDDLVIYNSCSRYVTLYLGVSFASKKLGVLLIKWLISNLTWFALDIFVKNVSSVNFLLLYFINLAIQRPEKLAIHMFSVYFYLLTPPLSQPKIMCT